MTQVGYWSNLGFPVYEPNTYLTPGYQGTLGYGFTTALGAKVGKPDVPVVSINGDGGFGFTLQRALDDGPARDRRSSRSSSTTTPTATSAASRRSDYGGRIIASDLVNPDYLKLADAFGVAGRRAETPDALRAPLREAINADEPTLIEVPVGVMPNQWTTLGLR